jgi:hypothetical protein
MRSSSHRGGRRAIRVAVLRLLCLLGEDGQPIVHHLREAAFDAQPDPPARRIAADQVKRTASAADEERSKSGSYSEGMTAGEPQLAANCGSWSPTTVVIGQLR